jgi:pimeloyl-ACP methyl ester carboxylesterase
MPALAVTGATRVGVEILAALPSWGGRLGFGLRYLGVALRFPALPHLMARRVRLMQSVDLAADCSRIQAPTLVITGDESLDRVVPTASTEEFVKQIRGARYAKMDRTGHLGSLTQPDRFARIVGEFVNASSS